jgi:hydroxypyruvate isomerase
MADRDWVANCSTMFREHDLLDRPAAAHAAGFDAIEFWWPFDSPVPGERSVDAFVAAIEDSGTRLAGLNFYAGDLAGADCGMASLPGGERDFLDSVDVAVAIGDQLGVSVFNALYGNRLESMTPQQQDETALVNLTAAAAVVNRLGATVLIEPISGPKPYPLRTANDAVGVVDSLRAVGADNVGLLCDVYHLAANGDDPIAAIRQHGAVIAHVQVADHPGRGEPGTGALDLDGCLTALDDVGYDGAIGLEYIPTTTTEDSLAWLSVPARRHV